jgi:hypothetical protein
MFYSQRKTLSSLTLGEAWSGFWKFFWCFVGNLIRVTFVAAAMTLVGCFILAMVFDSMDQPWKYAFEGFAMVAIIVKAVDWAIEDFRK